MESPEDSEIEALCSIWEDVIVEKNETSKIIRHKIRSMENEATSASVRIRCEIFKGYPEVAPKIELSMARGISEKDFEELKKKILEVVDESLGMPIVDVFTACGDFLTDRQHTSDLDCSICICPLSNSPINVTSCDHFLHFSCFSKYLKFCREEIVKNLKESQKHMQNQVDKKLYCPICRYILSDSDDFENEIAKLLETSKKNQKTLKGSRRKSTTNEDAENGIKRWRQEQKNLQKIFEKQKSAGGIIDIEEERKRYRLISEHNES